LIHYHGGPITPMPVAHAVWNRGHAFVSFERPEQVGLAMAVCHSVAFDGGQFSAWKRRVVFNLPGYAGFVRQWERHPAYDFHIGPDDIGGTEQANEIMLARWRDLGLLTLDGRCVPVWHLHESLDRLVRLAHTYPRVALGSSGEFPDPETDGWWARMHEAMGAICDEDGRPPCKLHGLRMLSNTIISQLPFASADSTNIARNHARYRKTHSLTPLAAAVAMREYIEGHAVATRWSKLSGHAFNMELLG
jgi:hypothetical protein